MPKQEQPEPPTNTSEQSEEIIKGASPEDSVISAFAAAIRFRTVRKALDEYNRIIRAQAETQRAFSDLDGARLEAERATELLKDAATVHETDKINRDIEHLLAKERLTQLQHESKLAKKERAAETRHATRAYQQEMHESDMSDEDREIVDAFYARMKPDRLRMVLEKAIKEQNLSAEDEENARKIMEELISRSL